jgi:hypothetical protein
VIVSRRLRAWRLPVVLLSVIIATGLFGFGGAVVAVGAGTMVKVSDTYWRDPGCDGTDPFVVDIWTDANYTGTRFRFCSAYENFCWVPFGSDSSAATLCETIGLDSPTLNDRASSIKVVAVNGGATCRVQLRDDANYTGASWVAYDPMSDADLGPVWPNDTWSSIRRVC